MHPPYPIVGSRGPILKVKHASLPRQTLYKNRWSTTAEQQRFRLHRTVPLVQELRPARQSGGVSGPAQYLVEQVLHHVLMERPASFDGQHDLATRHVPVKLAGPRPEWWAKGGHCTRRRPNDYSFSWH
jgi:hypothetical protein